MKTKISFFVSYAHKNHDLAEDFLGRLTDVLSPSRSYAYSLWMDKAIVVGDEWKKQIEQACNNCDLGLLLISPAFLSSKFISKSELPHFVGSARATSFPVMLQPVDFERHDLQGLDSLQIFRYRGSRFREPRAYGECRSQAREDFVLEVFREIEKKLNPETA